MSDFTKIPMGENDRLYWRRNIHYIIRDIPKFLPATFIDDCIDALLLIMEQRGVTVSEFAWIYCFIQFNLSDAVRVIPDKELEGK